MKPIFQNCKIVGDNVNNADYMRQSEKRGHTEYIMSRSSLMDLLKCPHKWIQGVSDSETKSTEWGTLVDCLLLTPEKFESQFAVCPETYPDSKTGEPKAWNFNATFCKEWRESNRGKIVVKFDEHSAAQQAVKIVRETVHETGVTFGEIVDSSRKQVMIMGEYKDSETGLIIPVKCLIDLVPSIGIFENTLIDFKTARNADVENWSHVVFEDNYDAQGWMQLEMFNAATGQNRSDFFNIVQENEPPYETPDLLVTYSEYESAGGQMALLDSGRIKIIRALKDYCLSLKTGKFKSYGGRISPNRIWKGFVRGELTNRQMEKVLAYETEYRTGGLPEIKRLETELAGAPLN